MLQILKWDWLISWDLFTGTPSEGDGPSQWKVFTAGREIQGDPDRCENDGCLSNTDTEISRVWRQRETHWGRRWRRPKSRSRYSILLLSCRLDLLIFWSAGSEQEAEWGANKGPACQGTGVCVGGGKDELPQPFSTLYPRRFHFLPLCVHILQPHFLLLLSGQGWFDPLSPTKFDCQDIST